MAFLPPGSLRAECQPFGSAAGSLYLQVYYTAVSLSFKEHQPQVERAVHSGCETGVGARCQRLTAMPVCVCVCDEGWGPGRAAQSPSSGLACMHLKHLVRHI